MFYAEVFAVVVAVLGDDVQFDGAVINKFFCFGYYRFRWFASERSSYCRDSAEGTFPVASFAYSQVCPMGRCDEESFGVVADGIFVTIEVERAFFSTAFREGVFDKKRITLTL